MTLAMVVTGASLYVGFKWHGTADDAGVVGL